MGTKRIHHKNQKQSISFSKGEKTSSALLIPDYLFSYFKNLSKKQNRTKILKSLLQKYKNFLILRQIESSRNIKTLYQKKGQSLHRISFKPDNEDWIELGIIASGLGTSRTYLFTYLLFLERKGISFFFQISKVKDEVSYLEKFRVTASWKFLKKREGFQRILWYMRP